MQDILLGLDIGTTNIKAAAVGTDGAVLEVCSRPTPRRLSEMVHDPAEMWTSICSVLQELIAKLPEETRPVALAIASMGETGVPVSESGEILYPFIFWHDKRSQPQAELWRQNFGAQETYQRTGLPIHPMYSLPKLLWLAENEPSVFANMRRWLCVEDFVIWRLTGAEATSYPIASRTMCFNLHQRKWDEEILSAAGIPPGIFPQAHPSGVVVGRVTAQAAAKTGLPEGLPIATGGHDHICAALASGAIDPGIALDSSGTAGSLVVALDKLQLDDKLMLAGYTQGCHVVPDKYYILGGAGGGMILEWLAKTLSTDIEGLLLLAEKSPLGAAGVCFLPYLRGVSTPNRKPVPAGLIFGLSEVTSRHDIARAALEGIAFEILNNLDFLNANAPVKLERLRIVGGGARSDFWNQMKADSINLPVELPKTTEATACGAALLAGLAVGAIKDWQTAARLISSDQLILPNPNSHAQYREKFDSVYKRLYPAVKGLVER